MGQLVQFAKFVKRKPARRHPAKPLAASVYFCTHCESDRFLLYPSGQVQCAGCGARIDNLGVSARARE